MCKAAPVEDCICKQPDLPHCVDYKWLGDGGHVEVSDNMACLEKDLSTGNRKDKNRRGHIKGLGLKTFSSHWGKLTFSPLVIRMC